MGNTSACVCPQGYGGKYCDTGEWETMGGMAWGRRRYREGCVGEEIYISSSVYRTRGIRYLDHNNLSLDVYTHKHTHTYPHTHTHTHTCTHTHTHTHKHPHTHTHTHTHTHAHTPTHTHPSMPPWYLWSGMCAQLHVRTWREVRPSQRLLLLP